MRKLLLVSVVAGALLAAPAAQADISSALGVNCTVASDNVRECGSSSPRSTSPSWDGTPIDVNIAFPPAPSGGTDGDYPLVIVGHGYGGGKIGFGASGMTSGLRRFTSRGYAVFAMTDRGFHESCGSDTSIAAANGACNSAGYIHLMDDRYEIRDAQFFAGELADEGLVNGQHVGAIGGSYGGGLSLQLATLRDRVMLPNGTLVPWTSPVHHFPMRIAAATPDIPWSDLAYSLTPNGAKLDYVADASYGGRVGIEKQSFNAGLFLSGQATGKYCGQAPYHSPCADPQHDVAAWKARLDQGEPYDDANTAFVLSQIEQFHSAYYIDHSEPPAPLLISNGFTDDLFPADEAITYFNRIRSQYPSAPISMLFGDFGHMRAANKPGDSSARNAAQDAWLDYYVNGTGSQPFQGTTAFAMTCPTSAPSGGPYKAASWAALQHGEVRLNSPQSRTISPGADANPAKAVVDTTFDPISPPTSPCKSTTAADLPGVATYRLTATGNGFTLMGSPTVIAKIDSPVASSQVAARLLDVAPNSTETLVDRQLYRPAIGEAKQVFQLHPIGHLFAPGHIAKLELLPSDSHGALIGGYGRASNDQGPVTVRGLELRLPVVDQPGGGQVKPPLPKLLPCGATLAPQFSSSHSVPLAPCPPH